MTLRCLDAWGGPIGELRFPEHAFSVAQIEALAYALFPRWHALDAVVLKIGHGSITWVRPLRQKGAA